MRRLLALLLSLTAGSTLWGQNYTIHNPPPAPPYVHPVPLDSGWVEITGLEDFDRKAPCLDHYNLYNSVYDYVSEDSLRFNQYGIIIRDSATYFKYRHYESAYAYGDSAYINCDIIGYSIHFPKIDFNRHNLLFYEVSTGRCLLLKTEGHLYVNPTKKTYLFFVQSSNWGKCLVGHTAYYELIIPKLNPTYRVLFRKKTLTVD